ncbi:MAG: Sec-independent protein translocase subunit TatA/TatB [Acidimicrobiales bacterium]
MGSIGPAEILVVLMVALIVLGPTKLPDAARSVGKALAELRRVTAGVQAEVRDAFAEPPTYPKPPPDPDAGTNHGAGTPRPAGTGTSPSLPDSPEQAEVAVAREPDPPPPA